MNTSTQTTKTTPLARISSPAESRPRLSSAIGRLLGIIVMLGLMAWPARQAQAADPVTLTLSCGATDVWAGEAFSVSAEITGGDPYSSSGEVSWTLAGVSASGESSTSYGVSSYNVTAGTEGGMITVTATYGSATATCSVNVHKLTGITASPADAAPYDNVVTFTATQDGGNHPSGPSWYGPVTPDGGDNSTAQNNWTSGGYYGVGVVGGTNAFGKGYKSIELTVEAFPLDEPAKAEESSGFGVCVNGDLGEPITYNWSGAVSGSGETATCTPSPGEHSASVDVTVAGQTVSASAELKAIKVELELVGTVDDFGYDATVTGPDPGNRTVTFKVGGEDIYVGSDKNHREPISESADPSDLFGKLLFSDPEVKYKEPTEKQRIAIELKNMDPGLPTDGFFQGLNDLLGISQRSMTVEYAVLTWTKQTGLYEQETIAQTTATETDQHYYHVSWDDAYGAPRFSQHPGGATPAQKLKIAVSLAGIKVKVKTSGAVVGFMGISVERVVTFSDYSSTAEWWVFQVPGSGQSDILYRWGLKAISEGVVGDSITDGIAWSGGPEEVTNIPGQTYKYKRSGGAAKKQRINAQGQGSILVTVDQILTAAPHDQIGATLCAEAQYTTSTASVQLQ